MLTPTQHATILHAFTKFDERASKRKGYNVWALGHYCAALENVEMYCQAGLTVRQAVIKSYLGRLCDCILKALGEPLMTKDEAKRGI